MGSMSVVIVEIFPCISTLVEEMPPILFQDALLEVEMICIDPAVKNGHDSPDSTEAELLRLVSANDLAALKQGGRALLVGPQSPDHGQLGEPGDYVFIANLKCQNG